MRGQHHLIRTTEWVVHAKIIVATLTLAVVLGSCSFHKKKTSYKPPYIHDVKIEKAKARLESRRKKARLESRRKIERAHFSPSKAKIIESAAKELVNSKEAGDNGDVVPPLPEKVGEKRTSASPEPAASKKEPVNSKLGSL